MVESFWAVPDTTLIRTPLTILREQAAALTEQTHGVLVGAVEAKGLGDNLSVTLTVTVPGLNDYRYHLLSYQQPIELYPGWLNYDGALQEISNEENFTAAIKRALSSEKVKNIITSLLAQVNDA